MNKISKYFRGVAEEAKRVRWPDQKTLWKAVAIVVVISVVAALATILSDYLTVLIMKAFEIALPTSSSSSSSSSEAAAMLVRFINGGLM
jgi:preprotein translocase SecE subunit